MPNGLWRFDRLGREPAPVEVPGTTVSHEEQREGREADISHRVDAVARRCLALVGQTGADRTELGDQFRDDTHVDVESSSKCRCKKEPPSYWGGPSSAYNMWQIGLSQGKIRHWPAPRGHAAQTDSERDSIALRTADLTLDQGRMPG
jgi:hypothetical protein